MRLLHETRIASPSYSILWRLHGETQLTDLKIDWTNAHSMCAAHEGRGKGEEGGCMNGMHVEAVGEEGERMRRRRSVGVMDGKEGERGRACTMLHGDLHGDLHAPTW